jgi:hypothetical protein
LRRNNLNETLERLKALDKATREKNQIQADTRRPPYRPNISEVEGKLVINSEQRNSKKGNTYEAAIFVIENPTVYAAREPHMGGSFIWETIWSDRANSAMGYFLDSLEACGGDIEGIANGATVRLVDTFMHDPYGRTRKWTGNDGIEHEDPDGEWYYMVVDFKAGAAAGASAEEAAIGYLVGKTADEFKASVLPYLQSQGIVPTGSLQMDIVSGKFVTNALSAGRVKLGSDGKYELV